MSKNQQVVKIEAKEFGLEENRAKEISAQFKPMLDKMEELEAEYNEVLNLPIDEQTCKKAKALRLKYVKVRTGTAKIHKEQKAFYVAGGKYVDGWKNAQLFASKGIEENLSKIENHFENIEKERIEKLKQERASRLAEYGQFEVQDAILQLNDDAFTIYLNGVKTKYEQEQEAIKKAEEEAKQLEVKKRLFEERKARLRPFMAFIPNEIFVDFDIHTPEDKFGEMLNLGMEEKEIHDKKQALIIREQKELQEKQEAIRKEQAKIEAEKKAIADAKAKEEAEAKKKEQERFNMDDSAKINELIEEIESIKSKYSFKSMENQKKFSNVQILLDKVVSYIRS